MGNENLTTRARTTRQKAYQSSPKTKRGRALLKMIELSDEKIAKSQEICAIRVLDNIGDENPLLVRGAIINGLSNKWTETQVHTFLEKHPEYLDYLLTTGDWNEDT